MAAVAAVAAEVRLPELFCIITCSSHLYLSIPIHAS